MDWNWTDDATAIDPANCTTSSTTTGEFGTPGQTLTATCANVAGTTSTASVTIDNVDKTAPEIEAAATTQPDGADGWYTLGRDRPLHLHGRRLGHPRRGVPGRRRPVPRRTAVESTARTVTDAAGNTSDPSNVVTVKIDKTGPIVDAADRPEPGAVSTAAPSDGRRHG